LFDFKDCEALADIVNELLEKDSLLNELKKMLMNMAYISAGQKLVPKYIKRPNMRAYS